MQKAQNRTFGGQFVVKTVPIGLLRPKKVGAFYPSTEISAGVARQCSGAGAICCLALQGLAGMIMEKGTLTLATADQSGVRMLGQKAVMLGIVCVGAAII